MFAIGVLVGCFNISTRDKLNKLDDLINKVLYEEDISQDQTSLKMKMTYSPSVELLKHSQ